MDEPYFLLIRARITELLNMHCHFVPGEFKEIFYFKKTQILGCLFVALTLVTC